MEAAAEWPPLVTLASGLFFTAAVARSASMWWVLSKYGKRLDDVEESLEAHRRIVQAARSEPDAFPLLDRIAIRVAFIYLLQFEAAGRRGGGQALAEGGRLPFAAPALPALPALPQLPELPAGAASSAAAAATGALRALQEQIPVLPVISGARSGGGHGHGGHAGDGHGGDGAACATTATAEEEYQLTASEERLCQAFQGSLNSAALALVLQAFATGLLVVASVATGHEAEAVSDGIQVANKAIAAELIFLATINIDNALYSEGWCAARGGFVNDSLCCADFLIWIWIWIWILFVDWTGLSLISRARSHCIRHPPH